MKYLFAGLAITVACSDARNASWPGPDKSAKPNEIAFLAPDGVAIAAGWRPLRLGPSETPTEVRTWIGGMGSPSSLYRLVRSGDHVEGELLFYWPVGSLADSMRLGRTTHEVMQDFLRGRCTGFVRGRDFGTCRATFTRSPDWSKILGKMEADDLWTLPDESALPNDSWTLDGWEMMVELRDHDRYRAYHYGNPDTRLWPVARHAARIASHLRVINPLTKRADAGQR